MPNKLLRGTILLSSASFLSKFLGFIYIIPFTILVGNSGYALFKYAYGPYMIMLSFSTMGIPLAISKLISKYDYLGRADIIKKILKSGIIFMVCTGLISFLILYFSAPLLADIVVDKKSSGNSLDSVTYVIKMVSFALIIIPPMSFLRGFFQGFQSMGPSAVSTVVEQLSRVLFILGGVSIATEFFQQSITTAVGIAAFGACIGGIFGIGVLFYYMWKRKKYILQPNVLETKQKHITILKIYKEIIQYSIPFVVIGLSLPIYQNIDTFTINKVLMNIGYEQSKAEIVNSVIGLSQIIVLIPVSITTGISVSIIPTMAKSFIQNNIEVLKNQLNQSMLILMSIILPSAFGIFILAKPLYFLLFGAKNSPDLGGNILMSYAPVAILIASYGVTSSVLQSINEHKKVIIGLFIGITIKFILNIILPSYFFEFGFIIATYCGYLFSLIFNVIIISMKIGMNRLSLRFRLLSIIISTLTMTISLLYIKYELITGPFIQNNTYHRLIVVVICTLLGIVIYTLSIYLINYHHFKRYLISNEKR